MTARSGSCRTRKRASITGTLQFQTSATCRSILNQARFVAAGNGTWQVTWSSANAAQTCSVTPNLGQPSTLGGN